MAGYATGGSSSEGCGSGGCRSGGCSTGGCSTGGCSTGGCGRGSTRRSKGGSTKRSTKRSKGGSTGCPAMHVYDWLSDMGINRPPAEVEVIEVAFKGGRRSFFRNTGDLGVHTGDRVIVEADRGLDFATVHMTGELVELKLRAREAGDSKSFPKLIRLADVSDMEQSRKNRENEGEAIQIGRGMAERLKLQMKIADVEWQFDRKKITFFFTAERRVDFRQLVRDLASRFRTRVELRQIGVRDEAARLGGIGSCGRELCCSTWLEDFKPVSTKAAKTQDLPLNPVRLSGQCGRLKCCLNYELEQYMKALERFPKVGASVAIRGAGEGAHTRVWVRKVDIFREILVVESEESGERIEVRLGEVDASTANSG